jgi:hypothetical protein
MLDKTLVPVDLRRPARTGKTRSIATGSASSLAVTQFPGLLPGQPGVAPTALRRRI